MSRQRKFSPIFCTQIPLEPVRKLNRLVVLFTGKNIRCCAAPILKVTDISDTFLCHSLAQCKQAFIRYHIAFYFDKKGVSVYCRCSLSLVSSVGRAPVCWAGGNGFEARPDQDWGSLNNWEESAAFVMTSANGYSSQSSRIRTKNRRSRLTALSLIWFLWDVKERTPLFEKSRGRRRRWCGQPSHSIRIMGSVGTVSSWMNWERLPVAPLYADVLAYCSHVNLYCKDGTSVVLSSMTPSFLQT